MNQIKTKTDQKVKSLYKYTSLENAKKSLDGKYIYLCSPEKFNDVFDSSLGFRLEELERVFVAELSSRMKLNNKSFIDIAKNVDIFSNMKTDTANERYDFMDFFLKDENFGFVKDFGEIDQNDFVDKLIEKSTDVTKKELSEAELEIINKFRNLNFNEIVSQEVEKKKEKINDLSDFINGFKFRVGCLTEKHTSNYMWALYADDFRGVCLEYDYKILLKETKRDLYKVNYSSVRPLIQTKTVLDFIDKKKDSKKCFEKDIIKIITTKSIEFEKELEWRIIKYQTNNEFYTKALKGIYVAENINAEELQYFINCAITNNISLYIMIREFDSFQIKFKKYNVIKRL